MPSRYTGARLLLAAAGAAIIAVVLLVAGSQGDMVATLDPVEPPDPAPAVEEERRHAPRLSRLVAAALDKRGAKKAAAIVARFKSTHACEVLGVVTRRGPDPGPIYGRVRGFEQTTKDVAVSLTARRAVIVAVVC